VSTSDHSLEAACLISPQEISDGACGGAVTRIGTFLMKSFYHSNKTKKRRGLFGGNSKWFLNENIIKIPKVQKYQTHNFCLPLQVPKWFRELLPAYITECNYFFGINHFHSVDRKHSFQFLKPARVYFTYQ
jgi:hypothetical protein